MRRTWMAVMAGLMSLSAIADTAAAQAGGSGTFTILHTNDFHGRHTPFHAVDGDATSQAEDPGEKDSYTFSRAGRVGGMAHLATAVSQVRAQAGDEGVLLLHAGDTFSDDLLGNLTRGEAVIELMNSLGYDFMALGNHDFDYGPERTRALQTLARFPMRGANVIDAKTGEPFLGDATLVLERGGVRVGLLALGYNNTPWTASKKSTAGLKFENGIEVARRQLPALRERADVVVVVSHLGRVADRVLAREVPGIDVIVGGHSHDHIDPAEKIGNTWIVQSLSDAAEYGQVQVRVAAGKVVDVQADVHTLWSEELAPDAQVQQQIAQLRAPHRARLEEVLFTAAEPIPRDYKSESAFDKMVAGILRQKSGADLAMLPGVGYGITLPQGPVTREALYTLLAHPAKLATVDLTGAQILRILEQSASNQKPANPLDTVGGLIQTAGMRWRLDLGRPAGERVSEVRIGGEPLDPEATYHVATHTGMLGGIHRYEAFAQGRNIERTDAKVVDVVEEALRGKQALRAPALGDIELVVARQ